MSKKITFYLLLITYYFLLTPFCYANLKIGDKAPGFILPDISDKKISLSNILSNNKPVIISFFATWCKPCLKEIPDLQKISARTGIKVYLINVETISNENLSKFLKEKNITLPVLMDPDAKMTGENYGVLEAGRISIPKLFLISPRGTIKYIAKGYGEKGEQKLTEKIAEIENESSKIIEPLAIFFTNSTNGYLESCDCPNHPYGGIVRRATYLKQLRRRYTENLLFDSGDIFPPKCSEELAECLLKSYEILNYDAVGIGDQEVSFENFINIYKSYKIPFISSNLNYCEGDVCRFISDSSMFFEKAGLKIAIVSCISPDVFVLYPPEFLKKYVTLPVNEAISGFISRNKGKFDLFVLISHSGFDTDKQIAADFPNIDLIVGGHSQTLLSKAQKVGKTLIVQAGQDAQNVGKLILKFDENKKVSDYDYELIPLTNNIPDEPKIRNLIKSYKQKIRK